MRRNTWLAVMLTAVLLAGCTGFGPGLGDWKYPLPNNYSIWRINGQSIVFGIESDHVLEETITGYVAAFCYGERFVGLQVRETYSARAATFWLADTETGETQSAENVRAFHRLCKSCGANDLCDWLETDSAPDGAKFPE